MKTRTPHRAWLILVASFIISFGSMGIIVNCSGIYLAPIVADLGMPLSSLTLHLTMFPIFMGIGYPIAGRMLAKYNIRVLTSVAMLISVLSYAACGFFTQAWQWWVAFSICGFFAAFTFQILGPTLLSNWFKHKTGVVIGVYGCASAFSSMIFNPVGAALIENFGWRNTYFIMAAISAVLVLPCTMFIINYRPSDVGMEPYGAEEAAKEEALAANTGPQVLEGVPYGTAVKSIAFIVMFLAAGLASFASAFSQHYSNFAISMGIPAVSAATLASAANVGKLSSNVLIASLGDKIGYIKASIINLVLCMLGMAALAVCGGNYAMMLVGAFLCGTVNTFIAVFTPSNARAVFGNLASAQIYAFCMSATAWLSAPTAPILAKIYESTGSYTSVWLLGAVIYPVIILFMFLLPKLAKKLPRETQVIERKLS